MLNKKAVLLSTGLGIGLVGFSELASADEVYTIQQGDTVSSIANKFNTTIDEIEKKNHFEDVNMIYVGEQLTIPTSTVQYKESTPVQVQNVSVQTQFVAQQQTVKPTQSTQVQQQTESVTQTPNSNGGSVKERFLAAGGTESMWNTIVMPESGGNPNAVSPNGYSGLGQTKESWGYGSVESQTQGMLSYAKNRYGSVEGAVAFRQANGWW